MANVLVVCETRDGQLKKIVRECLTVGRSLAEKTGGSLAAAAFGPAAASIAEEAGRFGAAKVYAATSDALDVYSTEPATAALEAVLEQADAAIVLIPATALGRDLAPRIAARRSVGVASDVVELDWDGKLIAKRPVYSGKAFATVEVEGEPAIATVRSNAFPAEESGGGAAEVVQIDAGDLEARARVTGREESAGDELTIAEADIIVSGGRGLKEADNFSHVRELASALGAAVGASRAVVDAGWIDHQHQVGQTGRVVSPNLYIACGISGAIQHLAGMRSSKHIIAINKDAEAPIFKVADLGVVGDLFEIVPALTEAVRNAKES